jgi:hypothetical protein
MLSTDNCKKCKSALVSRDFLIRILILQETIADEEVPKDFTTKIMPLLAVKKGSEADSAGKAQRS